MTFLAGMQKFGTSIQIFKKAALNHDSNQKSEM